MEKMIRYSREATGISLDRAGIQEFQQNRDPYLMVDYADRIIPGVSATGYKDLREDEWFFKVHWPGDPNMPGMLQIEALVQMAALAIVTLPGKKGRVLYITSASNLQFKKKILIGDKLIIKTKILNYKRGIENCTATGTVKDVLACKAEFNLIDPIEMQKFNVG